MYTGDFYDVHIWDECLKEPDVLIMECNWFNEPLEQPTTSRHMSFQWAQSFIQKWRPKRVVLVHMSHEDFTKKPKGPLLPSPPVNHGAWQQAVQQFAGGAQVDVAYDGLVVTV